MRTLFVGLMVVLAGAAQASEPEPAPYAGQHSRPIKALSATDVTDLLEGKGMGLAKAAELNGYAGPRHVLELAAEIGLTPEQRAATQSLFRSMQSEARALGQRIVEQEQSLDELFARRAVSEESLNDALHEIGSLQAQLRATHLKAHLAQAAILTAHQSALYNELRGYGAAHSGSREHHSH